MKKLGLIPGIFLLLFGLILLFAPMLLVYLIAGICITSGISLIARAL